MKSRRLSSSIIPQRNKLKCGSPTEYMDFVRNNPSHDDRTGTMKMSAEIRKDDVENLGNDDLTIKFGGASTTVKWEDIDRGNNSLLSDLRTWKSGANVNWEKGTIEYTVKIESTKGTNGKNATARDVMTAVNKQMALTNMTVTEVKTHSNWSQVPLLTLLRQKSRRTVHAPAVRRERTFTTFMRTRRTKAARSIP